MAVTPRATDDAECPLIDLEVMCEPEGARTQRGVTVGAKQSSMADVQGLEQTTSGALAEAAGAI